ncbi:MAG: aspartate--tRNA ligase [Sphingobacteriia bacterium 24-36-13]|jgi:aspartyl-tRNA synthetase|uniref:aspartate--tRNA ligase n=1 Tax=Sediminibacterium sp. TaxID=1917865 RepID=UPI000BD6AFDF|nr:aspartate--tRNA ligase [Sediminibacterium sp.]OYY08274.1 MAG: aspartate--tRNA ligase [Sphingobacteriia bacterium 35-36-14]OYZ51563.1 MAG: aspartate--tRNA ligase [Sphingobacteriia bacterium 24-36-13]OZA62805.1 MAG: aspartate--tRNA ligase [Sphingobacteriia bacterium 39-36-14]HQS25469.1 aspartate--tRNA ligase [Sediminibacterium sp.]HQS36406.1 aspartate--tRNA ligase [Sediminibacterium sp.]
MYRTNTCGELRLANAGQETTLAGWVQTVRKFGAITFVDLRDRYGITQLLFGEALTALLDEQPLGREYVLQVKGNVQERSSKNANISTGEIEIAVTEFKILNKSAVPPFTIQDDTDGGDDLRMKYRFLDLRRNAVKKNLELRYAVNRSARNYLHENSFMDIETPFLIKSTPEGARDFVVPSRMNPGQFYALPQSPQTFKQLLMVSGYDRYYQIVKCFRDEDLRADRQPEFTQIDCEMAFVEQEDILQMFEGLVKRIFKDVKNIDYTEQVERMSWEDAMWNYGNDKPDIRFGMKLSNLKSAFLKGGVIEATGELINGAGFGVFDNAETVLAIAVPGCAEYTRKQTDELTEWVKRPQIGMQGMVYIKCNTDGTYKSSVDKFYSEAKLKAIADSAGAQAGDLVLILAGREERTRKATSELRLEMGKRLGMRKDDEFKLLWVMDFPLFEYAEEDNRWVARHHPFTSPKPDHIEVMINNNPVIENADKYLEHPYSNIKANAYDMVLNGNEIGGGSIRIYQRPLQEKMFAALGMTEEEAQHKFGFLLGAFEYGAPPHGGIAFGFDRLCSILGGSESIRDFIAFPKNNSGRDVMLDAPSSIDDKQFDELQIKLNLK